MYLAKNQNNYSFALSSSDFCQWSGLGITAYNTAFTELKEQGYLVPKDSGKEKETRFIFYDKSRLEEPEENIIIEIPKEKVEECRSIQKQISNKQFTF